MTTPAAFFDSLRRKARTGILVEGAAHILVVAIAFMLLSYFLDRNLRLERVYRIGILVAVGVMFLWVLWRRVIKPLSFDLTDEELALAVERGDAGLEQALISTVQFERTLQSGAQPGESRQMMELVVERTRQRVGGLSDKLALDRWRVLKFFGLLLACLVVAAVWVLRDTSSFGLWARRNVLLEDVEWPRYTKLRFVMDTDENAEVRQAENDALAVEVVAGGRIPEQVILHYELANSRVSGTQAMDMSGDQSGGEQRFLTTLPPLLEGMRIHATGGDGLSEQLDVILIKRPSMSDVEVQLALPDYMGRQPIVVPPSDGELQMPIGASLLIKGRSSKTLHKERGAYVMFGKDSKSLLAVAADQMGFSGSYQPKASGTLTIDVEDRDGLGVASPRKLFLRMLPDRAPNVDFKLKGIGSMILYKARIPGELKIRDDYGLTKVGAAMRISGGKEGGSMIDPSKAAWELAKVDGVRQPEVKEGETLYHQNVVFDLLSVNDIDPANAKNRIGEGHLLAVRFDAEDNFGPGEHHRGESEILTLRVVSQNKLVEDLHRRQSEQRREAQEVEKVVRVTRMDFADMMSPTSSHEKAPEARRKLLAMSRGQRNLRSRIGGILAAYTQVVEEYANNRILEANLILSLRRDILKPLADLYEDDFPASAKQVEEFAATGQEDVRRVAIATYDSILATLKRLIEKMRRLESIAAILEQLKDVRATQAEVEKLIRKELDK